MQPCQVPTTAVPPPTTAVPPPTTAELTMDQTTSIPQTLPTLQPVTTEAMRTKSEVAINLNTPREVVEENNTNSALIGDIVGRVVTYSVIFLTLMGLLAAFIAAAKKYKTEVKSLVKPLDLEQSLFINSAYGTSVTSPQGKAVIYEMNTLPTKSNLHPEASEVITDLILNDFENSAEQYSTEIRASTDQLNIVSLTTSAEFSAGMPLPNEHTDDMMPLNSNVCYEAEVRGRG